MVDQNYSEFLLELGSNAMDTLVKQEPIQGLEINSSSSSASVPIPGGHRGTHGVFDQFSPSPLAINSIWNTKTDQDDSQFRIDAEQLGISFKMEDDDIFQVDKADLIQGPTLAELNANDDILLGDLNFDDLLLPEDNRIIQTQRNQQQQQQIINDNSGGPMFSNNGLNFTPNRFPQTSTSYKNFQSYNINSGLILNPGLTIIDNNSMEPVSPPGYPSPGTSNIAGSSTPSSSTSPHPIVRPTGQSTLHELLMRKGDVQPTSPMINHMDITQNEPSVSNPKVSRLSMSAPTQSMGLEQIWARREPRQHLLSTGSLAAVEIGSTSSISTGGALSPDPLGTTDGIGQLSHDEGYEDSDDDSDHYDDFSSENDSGGSDVEDQGIRGSNDNTRESKLSKKEKYFWQYNVQAKGPKGQRLVARVRLEDPHVLNEATDPVFSPHCALRGIKHSGKARKGDGNDLTPNPRKLHSIGRELDKLSRVINDMTPVSELPFTARPKTRKEKNKLASRACRLKKKAQHEANKIKLHGLEQEHKRLIHGIAQMKATLSAKASESNEEKQEELTKQMDRICKVATKVRIANHSTDFVNKVLDKVKAGVPDGGIDEF